MRNQLLNMVLKKLDMVSGSSIARDPLRHPRVAAAGGRRHLTQPDDRGLHVPISAKRVRSLARICKESFAYQEFLAEREEILRHKWLESERLGYDIGFKRALLD